MRKFGPGILVAAAFIGPGTVTTASLAGANFGFALVWALIFSIFTTIVLQNMASRLGIVSQNGLATALRNSIAHPIVRLGVLILIVAAIGIGNAAYQGGNILGAALAANLLTDIPTSILAIVMGALAFSLLFSGRYRLIETCLIILVSLMSVVFIACVVLNPPDWHLMVSQLIPNDISQFSNVMVIALIGTTVVPYNLFLHARAAQEKWKDVDTMQALQEAKIDTSLSIGMGGIVTLAILSTAATAFFQKEVDINILSLSQQLEPILGSWSTVFFGIGLFSAGLTSAITAPLAAAYAISETFRWQSDLKAIGFRSIWITILVLGTIFAATESKPLNAILFAQAANGLILPVIAIALLWVMNRDDVMGAYKNSRGSNIVAGFIVMITIILGSVKISALMA